MNLLRCFCSFFYPILSFSQIMFYLCTSFFSCCSPFSLIALPVSLALHWHFKENTLSQQLRSQCLETKLNCRGQNAVAPKLPRRDSSLDFTTELSLNQINLECKFNPFELLIKRYMISLKLSILHSSLATRM